MPSDRIQVRSSRVSRSGRRRAASTPPTMIVEIRNRIPAPRNGGTPSKPILIASQVDPQIRQISVKRKATTGRSYQRCGVGCQADGYVAELDGGWWLVVGS